MIKSSPIAHPDKIESSAAKVSAHEISFPAKSLTTIPGLPGSASLNKRASVVAVQVKN